MNLNLLQRLSNLQTCAGAAKRAYKILQVHSKAYGQKPEIETFLWTPEQAAAKGYGSFWTISWEAGPFEWAIIETGRLFDRSKNWHAEPYNGTMLQFFKD